MAEPKGPPPKNSPQWIKNEKIINETPYLRAARDRVEGFTPRGSSTHGGKGDTRRSMSISKEQFDANWDAIFGKKNNE